MRTPLLLDTTVLSNVVKVGRFDLLRRVFPVTLCIAAQVYTSRKNAGGSAAVRRLAGEDE
jgi:predicted nucleic acid-binding protein